MVQTNHLQVRNDPIIQHHTVLLSLAVDASMGLHKNRRCGFRLPASHVVHTVGPIYNSNSNPAASLSSAYRNSLRVAKDKNIQYITFPAISCGVFGYPYDEAATVAISVVREFQNEFKEIHFVLFLQDIYQVWVNMANDLMKN
nr:uncharacterized protein LOC112709195 [Arachis hypogaea]